jgi:hypothetical protein
LGVGGQTVEQRSGVFAKQALTRQALYHLTSDPDPTGMSHNSFLTLRWSKRWYPVFRAEKTWVLMGE